MNRSRTQLAEYYETPLSQLPSHVADPFARLDEHLARMGADW